MALNRISTEIIEVRLDAQDASQDLEAIEKRLEEVEKKVRGVDNATEKAGGGFSKLQAGITTAGAALAGLQAAAAAASAAIEAIKAPVSLAANFETQFAQVRTLNHEIGEDLKQQLLTLAAEVPQTAGDLTSAAYQAISAGIQPTDLMGFLTAASQTAVAAGGSLTEAVELLTAGVNSFGRQGETAASISNKLFATVRAGVTTIPELNAVFGRATAAASSYGVSVEEVLGAIAVLTKSGLPTTEAVTRINATLKELSSESGTAAKALKEQGVQLGVTALKQKGLVGVLEEVNEATRGQAAEIARLSGRQEAVQGILKLTGENMTAFSSTVKTIRNDTTAAADANAILANTTNNLNAQFEAAREGAIRELGMTILPAFNELLIAMTEELGNSGGAIEILGGAMELAVKAITAFVKSAKTIAITMAAAFGVRYAPLFLAQLAQMRAGLVAFNAMAAATGTGAGAAYGNLFKMGAIKGIMSIAKSPTILGLGVLIGQMIFSGIAEEAEEERRRIEENNRTTAQREMAEFKDREKIKDEAVNKQLALAKRTDTAMALRLVANKKATQGEKELAQEMLAVANTIDTAKGATVDLTGSYVKYKKGTEEILKILSSQKASFSEIVSGFRGQEKGATDAAEKIRILKQANEDLAEAQAKAGNNVGILEDQVELAEQDIELKGRQLLASRRNLKHVSSHEYRTMYGTEPARKLEKQIARLETQLGLANETMNSANIALSDYEAALSGAGEIIEENNEKIALEEARLAESNFRYEENKKIIEATITPMDRRIRQLKDAAAADRLVAAGSEEKIRAINAALKIQIKQIKEEDAAQKKAAAAFKKRAADRKRQLRALEKTRRATAAQVVATEVAAEKSINDSILRQMEATAQLELARLQADESLTPVEKLEARLSMESEFAQEIADNKIFNIDRELEHQIEAEETRSRLRIKDIENSKAAGDVKKKQVDAETEALMANIKALEQKRDAAVAVITDEVEAEEKAREQAGKVERGDALAEERQLAQERAAFVQQLNASEGEMSMALFEAEREMERLAFEEEMTRLKFTEDEKHRLRETFSEKTIELRQKEAMAIKRVEDEQRRSSLAMAQEGLQNLSIAADAVGAADSFVGKIEAAQIIAKGIFHGFQGASDQAAALSAFGVGNVAQGALLQSAAIAHFAQAAAAPVMARRALSGGGGGGGGAGAAAGGGVGAAASGPRTTARAERLDDQRERQPTIQFGDIVLADIPALLSSRGTRHLGRQIAADVTREINRSRALPGGARI